MLLDKKLWTLPMPAIFIFCDSDTTMCVAHNKMYNEKSKHISLRHAYIKELLTSGIMTIVYVRSNKNLVVSFIKSLNRDAVQ
ncbi:hypothetical protein MTR67_034556 [Solanum verrucosum]|uniref:Uncharacterized protein n=1 Tax=Solanum verrucosum TaxID=315347 RepID=A0AAF0U8N4_SOLVR|nr:hypothetical protein MTR67_034556 [Solanum verrucosum]